MIVAKKICNPANNLGKEEIVLEDAKSSILRLLQPRMRRSLDPYTGIRDGNPGRCFRIILTPSRTEPLVMRGVGADATFLRCGGRKSPCMPAVPDARRCLGTNGFPRPGCPGRWGHDYVMKVTTGHLPQSGRH